MCHDIELKSATILILLVLWCLTFSYFVFPDMTELQDLRQLPFLHVDPRRPFDRQLVNNLIALLCSYWNSILVKKTKDQMQYGGSM